MLAILAGIFAILNPLAGSVAVTLITGWSFLIIGVLQLIAVFMETSWGSRIWALLLGALAILAGISLLVNPLEGMISLTYLLAILFIVSGPFKVIASFKLPSGNWKWLVLISGGQPDGGSSCWSSGFLPTVYQGVQFRSQGDPVLFLSYLVALVVLTQLSHKYLEQPLMRKGKELRSRQKAAAS